MLALIRFIQIKYYLLNFARYRNGSKTKISIKISVYFAILIYVSAILESIKDKLSVINQIR